MFTCNSGPAFKAISTLCGKQRPTPSSALLSKDGGVLEGSDALRRFAGYFEELLDVLPPRRGVDTTGMSPLTADPPINTQPPTLTEVEAALTRLPSGKSTGVFGIQVELLKVDGGSSSESLPRFSSLSEQPVTSLSIGGEVPSSQSTKAGAIAGTAATTGGFRSSRCPESCSQG